MDLVNGIPYPVCIIVLPTVFRNKLRRRSFFVHTGEVFRPARRGETVSKKHRPYKARQQFFSPAAAAHKSGAGYHSSLSWETLPQAKNKGISE
jgi:hypothetical protein